MKYQVIIILDEKRNKSYYHSYTVSEDVTLGNIQCEELPPYQDINKAHACYWDTKDKTWVYDAEKYAEIIAEQEQAKSEAEEAKIIAAATPSNAELAEAILEIASNINDMIDAIAELGVMAFAKEGGEA